MQEAFSCLRQDEAEEAFPKLPIHCCRVVVCPTVVSVSYYLLHTTMVGHKRDNLPSRDDYAISAMLYLANGVKGTRRPSAKTYFQLYAVQGT